MRRLLPALLCALLLSSACGGGNGAPFVEDAGGDEEGGPSLFTFSGAFHTVGLTTNGTTSNTAFFGTATADAVGGLAGSLSGNQDGVVPLAPASYTAEYVVEPDGALSVDSFLGGLGHMTEDRTAAAFTGLAGGLNVWLRREGAFDASSLSGSYRFVGKIASSATTLLSIGGTITFDGAGSGTLMPEFLNNEGTLVGVANDPLSYTVSPAGDVEVEIRGLQTLTGGVGRGGEILVLAGGTATGQDPMVLHAVKQRTGASSAQLAGTYTLVLDRLAQTTHDRRHLFGTLTASGSDTASFADLLTPASLPAVPVVVADDGRIDLTLDGGYRVRGAIAAAGDLAFLAGGLDDGFDPGVMTLVRRRVLPSSNDLPVDPLRSASIPQRPPIGAAAGDVAAPLFGRRRITVGEVPDRGVLGIPGVFNGQGERVLLQFDLSKLLPGRTVARAVLATVQSAVENAPFTLGSLEVDHVTPSGVGFPIFADYDPPRRPLGRLGTLSTQPTTATVSLDVTAAVKADLADARSTSAFLLYFPTQDNDDNEQDRLILDDHAGPGPTPGPRTRLVITYE